MKVETIKIKNYRLLKDFSIDIERQLSLVIGKNNTGKTSFLSVLDKFLNSSESKPFKYHDFNVELKTEIENLLTGDFISEEIFSEKGIMLRIIIKYDDTDDLENISRIMMDLDPDNFYIALGLEYALSFDKYIEMRSDYVAFQEKQAVKITEYKSDGKAYTPKTASDFLTAKCNNYFNIKRKSLSVDKTTGQIDENVFISLDKEQSIIKDIINFEYISAKREVTNKENDKTLSTQTSMIYEKFEVDTEQAEAIEEFQDSLSETDTKLTDIYNDKLFCDIIGKINELGGTKAGETFIEVVSNLQHRELLKGNTTITYRHDSLNMLPEHYNGLGYMNLICMIFDIEIKLNEFKRRKDEKPADINILFIEEPEAHTHPQMQYAFINNIKKLVGDTISKDGCNKSLQCIISTHSSHIVADSQFEDIKYLRKENINSVIAKNLKDLQKEYANCGHHSYYKFLKQYLTLNRAELFFADKAIFVEGETESILLPSMMKKVDDERPENPLLSQNISVIPVGAHSKIFDRFIRFIGLNKGLIITDIDSYYTTIKKDEEGNDLLHKNGNPKLEYHKCPASDPQAQFSKNSSLVYFYNDQDNIAYFNNLNLYQKQLLWNGNKWLNIDSVYNPICLNITKVNYDDLRLSMKDINRRNLLVCYQTSEGDYIGRSFEDAFLNVNKQFIKANRDSFISVTDKWLKRFCDINQDSFELAENGIGSKPSFAIEILMAEQDGSVSWNIPAYIKEGLLWLKKD